MKRRAVGIVSAAVLVLLGVTSLFTVSETEYAIVTRFGKPVRTIQEAGLHLKRPWVLETVNRIERRLHVFTTQPIQLLLGDKNPIVLTCYICWRVSDPLLFFQSLVDTGAAIQKLGDMVNSQMGNALGDFTLRTIINTDPGEVKLDVLEQRILGNTNASAQSKYGIEVVQVGVRRIAYPAIVADSVYNRMRSEREKEAMKYRAEGREQAAKIRAKADREVTELLAEAGLQAQILRGEGDQQALKIYTEAYGQDREFFEFIKSMEAYRDILNSRSAIVLTTDSPLFKYLNEPAPR